MTNLILDTMPKNLSGLFTNTGEVEIEKTCEFLKISRRELAEAFNLSSEQLRPERISSTTAERLKELAGIIEYLFELFDGDKNKAKFWLNTPNLNFGGTSPRNLILKGRFNKVLKFVVSAKQGY